MNRYQKNEEFDPKTLELVKTNFAGILEALGEDLTRNGLVRTPERVARALHFMTQGYQQDALQILKSAVFDEHHSEMVIVKDIELYSFCEHHVLPFYGRAHIAYIPDGKIVGLSKLARVVDVYARRLQVQERLTTQVRDCIQEALKPLGVAVVIEAKHLCMMMRGVQKQNSVTTTSAFTGEFEKQSTRNEFINLISSRLS
jgi:GTP cyclohydrolase I